MSNGPSAVLSSDEIGAIARDAVADGQAGRKQAASQKIEPLRRAQRHQTEAAMALLWIVDERSLTREEAADVLSEIADAYDEDTGILSGLGLCLEAVRDIDDLNASAPIHTIFQTVVEKLGRLARLYEEKIEQEEILRGLATAAHDGAPAGYDRRAQPSEAHRDQSTQERTPLQSRALLQDARQVRRRRNGQPGCRKSLAGGCRQLRMEPWNLRHRRWQRRDSLGCVEADGAEDRDWTVWIAGGRIFWLQGEARRKASCRAGIA